MTNAYQSKQDKHIVNPKPSLNDQSRVHAQPDSYHYQRDEYGVDDKKRIATRHGVGVVRRRP